MWVQIVSIFFSKTENSLLKFKVSKCLSGQGTIFFDFALPVSKVNSHTDRSCAFFLYCRLHIEIHIHCCMHIAHAHCTCTSIARQTLRNWCFINIFFFFCIFPFNCHAHCCCCCWWWCFFSLSIAYERPKSDLRSKLLKWVLLNHTWSTICKTW